MSRLLNCNTDVEERTERDRAFRVDAAADWKDRSLMVERIVRGTIRSEDEAERSRWRVCIPETHCNKDVRYSGAEPWRHRYVSTASRNVNVVAVKRHYRGYRGITAFPITVSSSTPNVTRRQQFDQAISHVVATADALFSSPTASNSSPIVRYFVQSSNTDGQG